MNLMPLVGFYWRHGAQINAMIPKSPDQPSPVLDLALALAPVIKKHWPQYNKDGLLDDGIETLRELLAPPGPDPSTLS